jgi:deoxycytidine triphosphate deaminase
MYKSYYGQKKHLLIDPYDEKNHVTNFYYFSFGGISVNKKYKEEKLVLKGNEFKMIWSLEAFSCSERVLGIFGNISDLVETGVQLIHSPSIDPGFPLGESGPARLWLGIKNNTSSTIELPVGQRIGKVLFFDVSDTFIIADEFHKNELIQSKMKERRKAAKVLSVYAQNLNEERSSFDDLVSSDEY